MTCLKKIKILLLAPIKATGGIASWTHRLLKFSRQDIVEYRVVDTSKLYDPLGKTLRLKGAILGIRDAIVRMFKIFYAIIKYRPDIVYITSSPSIGLFVRDIPLMFMFKCFGMRCVSHLRGGKLEGFIGQNPVRIAITKWGLKTCAAVFVITREMEKYGREELDPQKIFYIPNMVEDELVVSMPTKNVYSLKEKSVMNIIHVAWQAPQKGSMELVEAMRYVSSPVCCKLIGQVAPEHEVVLKIIIQNHNLEKKVIISGLKKGDEMAQLFQEADLFVFPTHSEGFPNVVLEAMAYGLPVLATDVGNIREIIGFDSSAPGGMLLDGHPPINPVELARKIDFLLQNHTLREQMSKNGHQRVLEKYIVSKVLPNLEMLLVGLVRSHPTPQSINVIFEQKYL